MGKKGGREDKMKGTDGKEAGGRRQGEEKEEGRRKRRRAVVLLIVAKCRSEAAVH